MLFSNLPVDTALLPRVDEPELKALPTAYRRLLLLEWTITALLLLSVAGGLFFFIENWRDPLAMGITGAVIALLLLWYLLSVLLGFPALAYALREHDLLYRKGWLFRSLKVCPFNRIQNCSINRGPLDRRYGLATLVLFTAGAQGADLRIPGLPLAEAEGIQEYLLKRIHGTDAHAA